MSAVLTALEEIPPKISGDDTGTKGGVNIPGRTDGEDAGKAGSADGNDTGESVCAGITTDDDAGGVSSAPTVLF